MKNCYNHQQFNIYRLQSVCIHLGLNSQYKLCYLSHQPQRRNSSSSFYLFFILQASHYSPSCSVLSFSSHFPVVLKLAAGPFEFPPFTLAFQHSTMHIQSVCMLVLGVYGCSSVLNLSHILTAHILQLQITLFAITFFPYHDRILLD